MCESKGTPLEVNLPCPLHTLMCTSWACLWLRQATPALVVIEKAGACTGMWMAYQGREQSDALQKQDSPSSACLRAISCSKVDTQECVSERKQPMTGCLRYMIRRASRVASVLVPLRGSLDLA